jgi:hypothetical protein
MDTENCSSVATFTEAVAGEIVTLIFVTGSVHVDVEVVDDEVEDVVVQVTAVLAGAAPQEVRLNAATSKIARTMKRFTAPLSPLFQILLPVSNAKRFASNSMPEIAKLNFNFRA